MNVVREMLAISRRHPFRFGRAWLGFLFLVTLPSYARDEPLYEGPCLPITLGSRLHEFGEDAVVCDPCCVVILPVDNPSSLVTVASSPSATSLSGSFRPAPPSSSVRPTASSSPAHATSTLHALTTPSIALPSTSLGTYLGQGQENGDISGCASFQPAVQPTTSCTLAAPPTPSLAFTILSPITFSPTLAFSPVTSPPPASTTSYMITRPNIANVPSSKPSATVVAVISIASFLGLASLLLGALLYARARRSFQHRSRIRVSDSEFGTLNTYDYWRTSGDAPPRPRNPYEGSVPSYVPLLPPDPAPPIVHVTALSPRLRTATGRS